MNNKTLSVLICAFNEQRNIGKILDQILEQKINPAFTLEKIIVVSDDSTDDTNNIVSSFSDARIELKINEVRLGKPLSFNYGKSFIQSDYILSLDADVQLHKDAFVELLTENVLDYDLIVGKSIPTAINKYAIASLASFGTYFILSEIISRHKNTIFPVRGTMVLLSERLYRTLVLPNTPGTDQYMYWSCKKQDGKFLYKPSSIVYYTVPGLVKDYVKQNKRFYAALEAQEKKFGKVFVHRYDIPLFEKLRIFIYTLIKHPLSVACWLFIFIYSRLSSLRNKRAVDSGRWDMASSTK